MHYLVTGGAGFIGSNLCRYLLHNGHSVICLDNLSSGFIGNIETLKQNQNFEFVKHDVTVPYDFPVDGIFNLACPASPKFYLQHPIETTITCVLGAVNALNLARKHHAKVLQASTSEVYGDPKEHPQQESYFGNVNITGPRSCYDEGKRCAESLFFDYRRLYGTEIKVARIFNTYGPLMLEDDGRVVSNFIVQALRGDNLTVHGDGLQTRSFCYIDDLVQGLVKLMDSTNDCTGPFNLGNPVEFTMLDLAQKILNKVGGRSKIEFMPLPVDDPKVRQPDISLAQQHLLWQPQVALNEGLNQTIDYFRTTIYAS